MARRADRTRKTYSIFASFIMCCLGTSLMVSAIATQYWFTADCTSTVPGSNGNIHFGLFSGSRTTHIIAYNTHALKIVCLDGECMFSCGRTPELRKEQLLAIRNHVPKNFSIVTNCGMNGERAHWASQSHLAPLTIANFQREEEPELLAESSDPTTEPSVTTDLPVPFNDPEFMSHGLWAGTIACLVIGMVFAVVGALFAVINTATTPVEAVTGVPGLYMWNGLAALFNLICVILWAVQFHQHLTKNVLLYDAPDGWTTEDMEVFGYSFWLVVVAIIVHIANIIIIYVGTYERKVKEQIERPEDKTRNIMLY